MWSCLQGMLGMAAAIFLLWGKVLSWGWQNRNMGNTWLLGDIVKGWINNGKHLTFGLFFLSYDKPLLFKLLLVAYSLTCNLKHPTGSKNLGAVFFDHALHWRSAQLLPCLKDPLQLCKIGKRQELQLWHSFKVLHLGSSQWVALVCIVCTGKETMGLPWCHLDWVSLPCLLLTWLLLMSSFINGDFRSPFAPYKRWMTLFIINLSVVCMLSFPSFDLGGTGWWGSEKYGMKNEWAEQSEQWISLVCD